MKELVEKIENQISTDKDVITVLPRNGIKAIKTLLETIKETTEKYEHVNEKLLKEIEERYNQYTIVEDNQEIPKLEEEILTWMNCRRRIRRWRDSSGIPGQLPAGRYMGIQRWTIIRKPRLHLKP